MKKIFMCLVLTTVLIGCENENKKLEKVQKTENKKREKIYSTAELEKLMNKIINSEEDFLSELVYFQKGIKPQNLSFKEQKEIIWLQVDEQSTNLDWVELSNRIEEKLGIPKDLFRVDLVKEPTEYIATKEPY